jgi:hypothetical protein
MIKGAETNGFFFLACCLATRVVKGREEEMERVRANASQASFVFFASTSVL